MKEVEVLNKKISVFIRNKIPIKVTKEQINEVYSSEADILNVALFGKTANNNKIKNKNIRDSANIAQLICLSNLELINAMLIEDKISPKNRLIKLNKIAISQMKILNSANNRILKNKGELE